MDALKDAGLVDERIFSFYLTNYADEETLGKSYIDIGYIDDSAIDSEIIYIDVLPGDFWWTNYVEAISFTHPDQQVYYPQADRNVNAWSIPKKKALTDTGSSCTLVNKEAYEFILSYLLGDGEEVEYDEYWGYIISDEKAKTMPSIFFLYGGYWMEMMAKDYLVDFDDGTHGFCIMETTMNYWILGNAFMRGFYNVHNHETMQYGFAPIKGSTKSKVIKGEVPPYSYLWV